MSLRCLFVVSLTDSQLLFYKSFPTVEKRWSKDSSSCQAQILPSEKDLLVPLLNELGILHPTLFQTSRDSCQKNLQAPLFWIPYDSCSQIYWPVVVVECQTRLLCGVPFLEQLHPFGNQQSMSVGSSHDVVVVLELLSKLVHIVQLPVSKMSEQLNKTIQQWLPFGRASGHQQLELLAKPATTQKAMWLRSKPKVEVHVKEEVRMTATSLSNTAELFGTVTIIVEPEVDCNGIKLELSFGKLPNLPSLLFHPSVFCNWGKTNCSIKIQQLLEKTFPLCHYNSLVEFPPIQPVLKIRTGVSGKTSIFLQLHISPATTRTMLKRLEIRLAMPIGNHIARILTAASQMLGFVSLIKDGTQLLWNLTPLATSSSNTKLKEDMVLNVDVEMDKLDASLVNAQALIFFSGSGSTLSGVQLSLQQPSEFKLVSTTEFKSSSYRAWNYDSTESV